MEGSKPPRKVKNYPLIYHLWRNRSLINCVMKKACDFCYLRKIKCNGQKPRCSHCVAYAVDCTYAAPSRQSRPKKRKTSAKIEDVTIDLQSRVRQLEVLLEQVIEHSKETTTEQRNEVQPEPPGTKPIPPVTLPARATTQRRSTDHNVNSPPKLMDLPPLQQVLPLVHLYLDTFNSVLPLFHAETLLRLIHDSYSTAPQHRDPVAWAAINVVLALAHQLCLTDGKNSKSSAEHLSNAQLVLSDVALRDVRLLNVQVLVGMVIIVQGSLDLQPALILLATTMRLVHKLGLHNRASSAHLSPAVAKQRANVFWLAYILDKDLSVRSKQPSIQLDDDIDLDLPYPELDESRIESEGTVSGDSDAFAPTAGVIATADGTVKMNYFVTRIQLAVIEGGVYDYLHSTRSQKRSPEERSNALESVARALEQWKATIPPEFNGIEASRRVSPNMLLFLCGLDATSMMCMSSINKAHAWNAQWVASLRTYSRDGTAPVLPPRWEALVDEARGLMVLYGHLGVIDPWTFW